MKIVQINATCNQGSTGRIAYQISELLNKENIENYIFYSMGHCDYPQAYKFCSRFSQLLAAVKSRILGNQGFENRHSTRKIIRKLKKINPDIVHLHNIQSHDVHISMLFNYLNKEHKKVIWTFHDCGPFTGGCMHFDYIGCEKWKTVCQKCPLYKEHSWFFDRSKMIQRRKKEAVRDADLTVVTPSKWLKDLAITAGFKDVRVINNGIDVKIYQNQKTSFKDEYHIQDKIMVLAGSFIINERKGAKDIIALSHHLDYHKYALVIIGIFDNPKDEKLMNKNAIMVGQIHNQSKLAEIYQAADVFINPTYEDTFPTINMEAIASNTPVVCYKTGGAPETMDDKTGLIIPKGDVDKLLTTIDEFDGTKFKKEDFVKKSLTFNSKDRFQEYINLYKEIVQK